MKVERLANLCWIFCCPPLFPKIITKLIFQPPQPTYTFEHSSTISSHRYYVVPIESVGLIYRNIPNEKIEGIYATSSSKNRIACLFVRICPNPRFTILYSHGNTVDQGMLLGLFFYLGSIINCDVFSYDYSGYGLSTGKPSNGNLLKDIECAWKTLTEIYDVQPQAIIIFGQSIGTVPSIYLASKYKVRAVVLQSPITSALRELFPSIKRTFYFDIFKNITMIKNVNSPVLVIHGKKDRAIDFSHGQAIYERCPKKLEPLWLEDAGHNDVENHRQYYERLNRLVNELKSQTDEN